MQIFGPVAFIEQKENDKMILFSFCSIKATRPENLQKEYLFLLYYHFPMEDSRESLKIREAGDRELNFLLFLSLTYSTILKIVFFDFLSTFVGQFLICSSFVKAEIQEILYNFEIEGQHHKFDYCKIIATRFIHAKYKCSTPSIILR